MQYKITLRENNTLAPQYFYSANADMVNYIWNKNSVDEAPLELFEGEPLKCGNDHIIIVEVEE